MNVQKTRPQHDHWSQLYYYYYYAKQRQVDMEALFLCYMKPILFYHLQPLKPFFVSPRLIVTFVSYNIINSTANGLQSCFGAVLLVRWDWSPLCRAFHQDDDLVVTIECLC